MITRNVVMTTTPIVLNTLSSDVQLLNGANDLVIGLTKECANPEGYTLSNIVESLHTTTQRNPDHEALSEYCESKIVDKFKDTFNKIRQNVIPACDILETEIKKSGSLATIEDLIFAKLLVDYQYVPTSLLSCSLLTENSDSVYQRGVSFDTSNLTNLGNWPGRSYDDIVKLINVVKHYPELAGVINNPDTVMGAWKALGHPVDWLKTYGEYLDIGKVNLSFKDLSKLIVLTLIVSRLVSQDDPLEGVTGITLENYRSKLKHARNFLTALLSETITRWQKKLSSGMFIDDNVVYEKCTETESLFFGEKVLSGTVTVLYNDSISNLFYQDEKHNFSDTILGILFSAQTKRTPPKDQFIDNLDFYNSQAQEYRVALTVAVNTNFQGRITKACQEAIYKIAQTPEWQACAKVAYPDYLDMTKALEKRVQALGGFGPWLRDKAMIARVVDGEIKLANSHVGGFMARVFGLPLAEKILLEGVKGDKCATVAEQREVLTKSVINVIVRSLLLAKKPAV